jgi:exodeoxyribonuclease-3
MRMASWNVNGIRAAVRNGFVDWLDGSDFDLVFVQETKATVDQLPPALRDLAGWGSAWHSATSRKGYSGVAVFWRDPPDEVFEGLGDPAFDIEGRLVGVRYGDRVVLGGYIPNGGKGPERVAYKLRFTRALLAWMQHQQGQGREVVVCGDFNTALQPIDLARPRESQQTTGFLPEEREALRAYLEAGFVDSFRHLHPGEPDRYSWWDLRTRARERNRGWRIDYFFVDGALRGDIVEADILDGEYGSDHAPVVLELAEPAAAD